MSWYFLALKKYAVFKGRACRKEFWMFWLINQIIIIFLSFIEAKGGLSSLFWLLTVIPTIAAGVRRMHDIGKSGWFMLIPLINFIFLALEGDNEDNQFGPVSKSDPPEIPTPNKEPQKNNLEEACARCEQLQLKTSLNRDQYNNGYCKECWSSLIESNMV